MRRATRNSFNALAWLSLVLFLATLALWVWTWTGRQLDWYDVYPVQSYGVGTERGAVIAFLQRQHPDYRDGDRRDKQIVGLGFRYLRITSDRMRRWNLVIPLWLPSLAFAVLPTWQWRRWARDRHRAAWGQCMRCGYDLAGNVSGACPECGTRTRADGKGGRPSQAF